MDEKRYYTTVSGDMWDSIACAFYGDVNEALEMSQQKFNEMMDRWKKGKERTSFA